MRGPIDYIIVGFEGNNFKGDILNALSDAIDKGIIDVLAVSLISKDEKGEVTEIDVANLGDTAVGFVEKYKPTKKHVTEEDIAEVADLLENNTSAGLLIVEQLWAKPLKEAIVNANGVLVAEGRIHPEAAVELEK
jgi:hypothetical protein